MSRFEKILENFKKQTKSHKIKVIKDGGIYRHIVMQREDGSTDYKWEILTFPQYLTIVGDIGSYTFKRLEDMFNFFRDDDKGLGINPHYWHEKVVSESIWGDGCKTFKCDDLEEDIKSRIDEWVDDYELDEEEVEEFKEELQDQIFDQLDDNGTRCYDVIGDFESSNPKLKNIFEDHWEMFDFDGDWSNNYLLCLLAIVHTINVYDEQKASE